MSEAWKAVPGYEGLYEVSDRGRVRSLSKTVPHSRKGLAHYRGGMMTPKAHSRGYLGVTLSKAGMKTRFYIHRLVLMAFDGPPKDGEEACHGDGNRRHNHLGNLRWDTASANCEDAFRHGRRPLGERHKKSKLREDQVREIRLSSENQRVLAERLGVSQSLISVIKQGKIWTHLT